MRRLWVSSILFSFLSILTPSSSASDAFGMSTETPSSDIYQIEEFLFTGLSIFNGSTYVENSWFKVRVAFPKQVKCNQWKDTGSDNCVARVSATAESSVSLDSKSTFKGSVLLTAYIQENNREEIFASFYPTVPLGKSIGTHWTDFQMVFFSMKSTGVASISVGIGALPRKKPTVDKIILIPITVKTQADVDAENAAQKAAAEAKAARDRSAAEVLVAKEQAAQDAKKLTITCIKGKQTRRITGESPSCPAGFKNPIATFATYQAFSTCRLYKKDSLFSGAKLKDGGRTLILDAVRERNYGLNTLSNSDYLCASKVMKMPAFVDAKIGSTRAIDGMQTAQWGKLSAFWNYHPDNGLNITFNSK